MKKLFKEFRSFISRGNIVDLAVAVIIGAAFSAIVTSLVNDIVMPLIVRIFPVQDLSSLSVVLRPESAPGAGDALTWNYGNFIQALINFILISLVIFAMIKLLMGAKGALNPKHGQTFTREEYRKLRRAGRSKKEIATLDAERLAARKAEEERQRLEAQAASPEALLKRAVELLEQIEAKDRRE